MRLMFTFGIRLFKRAKAFCLIAVAGGGCDGLNMLLCELCSRTGGRAMGKRNLWKGVEL